MDEGRVIFHIDVNNAFLSWTAVKLLNEGYKIDIRDIASVIGGDEESRHGIVLAKSPVAKKYGISTAETLYSARKKCPNLKIFPPEMEYYSKSSKMLFNYLGKYSPDIEQCSIDECFIDMSHTRYLYKDLIEVAHIIKEDIKKIFGFTVNVGIGNNKLCAKMASDFEKPNKVHTLFKSEVKDKIWDMSVNELYMVGRKTSKKLLEMGIKTIGDLANSDINMLRKHFKSFSEVMWKYANGIDNDPIVSISNARKSISTSFTLSKDIDDINKLKKILLFQVDEVGVTLRKKNMYTSLITITFKTKDFVSYSKQIQLRNATDIMEDIYKHAVSILEIAWNGEEIRSIGVRLGNLKFERTEQISLFEKEKPVNIDKIQKTIDSIKEKYGSSIITPASLVEYNKKTEND